MGDGPLTSSIEERVLRGLRSRTAGVIGTLVAVVAFALLLQRALASDAEAFASLRISPSAVVGALIAFMAFQACAAGLLGVIGGRPAPRLWATAQVIKYLPTPGSAMAGMMTGAIRSGYDLRHSLGFVLRHSGLLAGTASISGAPAFARVAADQLAIAMPVGLVVSMVAGLGLALASVRPLPARSRGIAITGGTVTWSLLGAVLWVTIADAQGSGLIVSSAFPAAWVVGLAALPVPAGIGVREGALILGLGGQIGADAALAYGIVTRLVQVASDCLFAMIVLGGARLLPSHRATNAAASQGAEH